MAPILSGTLGITPQIIDDARLCELRSSVEEIEFNGPPNPTYETSGDAVVPLDIEKLVSLLEPWQVWAFEEQVSFLMSCLALPILLRL